MVKIKKIVVLGVASMMLALSACGKGSSSNGDEALSGSLEDMKHWTEGTMEINGTRVAIGKTTIDDFIATTGFSTVTETNDQGSYSTYKLSDGYSDIMLWVKNSNQVVMVLSAGQVNQTLDLAHTTIIGPAGIKLGESKVDDLAAYDQNMENRYVWSAISESEGQRICQYMAALQSPDNEYMPQKDYHYTIVGDLETRIVFTLELQCGAFEE